MAVNGKVVTLNGNEYEWTLTGNTTVEIAFVSTSCTVTVNCGYGGNYELSKQAPYTLGDEVTLTVTPNAAHNVKSVTVNGADVTEELVGGKYTFTLSANVEISIEFSVVLTRDAYIGTWKAVSSSDMLANELVIGEDSFTFNDKSYTLTPTENGYSFTVTEGEDVYQYSFTLEEVGEGKFLLILTIIMPDSSKTVQTCTKEGVNYSVDFPEELWGDWDAGASRYPISIGEDGLTIAGDTAIVHSYDASTKTYKLLAGGTEYTLVWNEAKETLTLTIVGDATSAAVYTKTIPPEETLFTQFAGNYYTNGAHYVQIGADGSFTFDGTLCHIYPVDASDPNFGYNFHVGSKLWQLFSITETEVFISDYTNEIKCYTLTGDEAYTVSVTCGDNGSYKLSDPKNGGETYGGYEQVTVTVTPAEGYRLDRLTVNDVDVTDLVVDNAYKFYISKNSTVKIEFVSDGTAKRIFPDTYYNNIYHGKTTDNKKFDIEFTLEEVIFTYDGTKYTASTSSITDMTVTGSRRTFSVTFEGLGTIQFEDDGVTDYFKLSGAVTGSVPNSRDSVEKKPTP